MRSSGVSRLKRRALVAIQTLAAAGCGPDLTPYATDPLGFCRAVLGVEPTPDQCDFLPALHEWPRRVKVKSGHGVGKTFGAAVAAVHWFYTRPQSVIITTAPTERDVIDLLWTEIRLLVARAKLPDLFVGPVAPEMRDGGEHWAKGYTARKGESFQGRHRPHMLFIFDEDEGLEASYWKTTNTMFKPDMGHSWLAIGNPTTTTSQSFAEESLTDLDGRPKWRLFTVSCLTHPNILAGQAGRPLPVPNAVTLAQVNQYVADWCQPVPADQRDAGKGDIEWPTGSGRWYRPGPLFQSRVLGIRPPQGTTAVWGEGAWQFACRRGPDEPEALVMAGEVPEVGVDVAVYGDDWTTIHSRVGPVSLAHRAANGWPPDETAGQIKAECRRLAEWANNYRPATLGPVRPEDIRVKVELDGYGAGVLSHGDGWNWVGVSASGSPNDGEAYPNRRSEVWFVGADRAAEGRLDVSRLPADVRQRLRQQLLMPTYKLNGAGQKVVEPKVDTKKRLGRSPDDADGFNMAYAEAADRPAPFVSWGTR